MTVTYRRLGRLPVKHFFRGGKAVYRATATIDVRNVNSMPWLVDTLRDPVGLVAHIERRVLRFTVPVTCDTYCYDENKNDRYQPGDIIPTTATLSARRTNPHTFTAA